MINKKTIPIVRDPVCTYKWTWNTFYPYLGEASSCHRIKEEPIDLNNFDEQLHNTPIVMEDRQRMQNGEWPDPSRGCVYCKNIEDAGGTSDRMYSNSLPIALEVDFTSLKSQVLISEVYLNNTCDLGCLYCSAQLSSKINSELIKYGPDASGQIPITKFDKQAAYTEKYLSWVNTNYMSLRRLSILGGEPLLQKEFWRLMDRANTQSNPELEISINTNLNASFETIERLVSTAKELVKNRRIKRFDIICSLDCWGDQAEFVRYGLNLERWQKNFEYLIKHKWIYVSVLHVVTSLTIKTANELQQIILNYKKQGYKISQTYSLVVGKIAKDLFHPSIFGSDFFKDQLEDLLRNYPITEKWDNNTKQLLDGITKLILNGNKQPDLIRLKRLKTRLDEIDTRRGTDWKSLYPEINEFMIEHVV